MNGKTYQISTEPWEQQGKGRGKNTAAKVGGGAAVGALIGGLIGGGKGAAIGAGVGAGGGTAAQGVTKGQQVTLASESIVNFKLSDSLTVTPVGHHNRNADSNGNGNGNGTGNATVINGNVSPEQRSAIDWTDTKMRTAALAAAVFVSVLAESYDE